MALTPLEIHNKEFSRKMRGYSEDEVNEFLDQVIKDYEQMIREVKELKEQNERLEERIRHFDSIEDTLSKTIVVAQEAADEMKLNARKESQLIVKEAEKNADRIINEAISRSRKIALENEELRKQAAIYRTRFISLVEAQLELVRNSDWNSLHDDQDAAEGTELTAATQEQQTAAQQTTEKSTKPESAPTGKQSLDEIMDAEFRENFL